MIYLDTSVALAQIFSETRRPPAALWEQHLISSRLLEFEIWTRVHGRGCTSSHSECAREVLVEITLLEMNGLTQARALEPFPLPVRTLDALHLASLDHLRSQGNEIVLATYDDRLAACAKAMEFVPAEV